MLLRVALSGVAVGNDYKAENKKTCVNMAVQGLSIYVCARAILVRAGCAKFERKLNDEEKKS